MPTVRDAHVSASSLIVCDHDPDKDHVICNYCDTEAEVERGEDVCPRCGFRGALAWACPER